jgi:hypothetical protein
MPLLAADPTKGRTLWRDNSAFAVFRSYVRLGKTMLDLRRTRFGKRFSRTTRSAKAGRHSRSRCYSIHPRRTVAFDGHPRCGPRGRDNLLAEASTVYRRHLFMRCGCCPNLCPLITQIRSISRVVSIASSRFGLQRPASGALIGVPATASVISLALSLTCLMDIARA